jgi:FMN phosphatase YigB (HAD superfamily)
MSSCKKILFIDFDGTLCHDRYWRTLPQEKYKVVQETFFGSNRTIVNDWMRGKYTSEQINTIVARKLNMPYEEIWNLFKDECFKIKVSEEILKKIKSLRKDYVVILVTGNMDSFFRFTENRLNLKKYFDLVINSYEEGSLKTDNNGETFLKYAKKFKVPIKNCFVIDDSKNVCNVFQKLGGESLLITKEKDIGYYLDFLSNFDNRDPYEEGC